MILAESHTVPILEKPIRLQEYAVGIFKKLPTKSGIKKAIKKELILVNQKKTTTALFIKGGERIELYQNEDTNTFKRLDLHLEILFEDDYLAVIYKPAGIIVSGNSFATIDNALAQNLQKSKVFDAVRPRPVHRLDYPTSGVLLVGKTSSSIIKLNQLFEHKKIQKIYYAITIGNMKKKGTITKSLDGKEAITEYRVLQTSTSARFDFLNLVELIPKTGRKHQLRIHMASMGNQILGDKDYGEKELMLKGKGLYLYAFSLRFIHPITNEELLITKALPNKFHKIFPKINL